MKKCEKMRVNIHFFFIFAERRKTFLFSCGNNLIFPSEYVKIYRINIRRNAAEDFYEAWYRRLAKRRQEHPF